MMMSQGFGIWVWGTLNHTGVSRYIEIQLLHHVASFPYLPIFAIYGPSAKKADFRYIEHY